jgi:hypothetical protein
MKKLLMIIPLVFLLCFTFSCQQKGEEVAEEPAVDVEAEKANVKLVMEQYVKAWKTLDMDLYSSIFSHAEDLVIFNVDKERTVGWEALKEGVLKSFEQYKDVEATFRDVVIDVHVSGGVAWLSCLEDWNYVFQGEPGTSVGVWTTWVLEKQDSIWVIVHAHWSSPKEE